MKIHQVLRLGVLGLVLIAAGCGDDSSAGGAGANGDGGEVALVAYSTPAEAYADIFEAFKGTDAGSGVEFSESYGSSGEQSRAVEAGQPAGYLHFALEPDMTREVDAGLVAADWNAGTNKGVIVDSVAVFMVREGNPMGIDSWDDLTAEGVDVINPNPFTSGGARWNVMAAYGAQLEQGKTPEEAEQYLYDLYENVSVQDDSARDALATFTGGKGDVLLGYENEAILAQEKGEPIEYVIPDQTILIETVGAVTENAENPEAAQAFLDFVLGEEGQQIFADHGFRPVLDGVTSSNHEFPVPASLFTIADLGGWEKVKTDFFDEEAGIMAKVEQSIGVSTAG